MFQMKIFSSSSENRICVWSLLSQLVFARIHPSLLKSPESSQCLHQKGESSAFIASKSLAWIHLEHESSLERWYCWAVHPARVMQANVTSVSHYQHQREGLLPCQPTAWKFAILHVSCHEPSHASCLLLTIVNNDFNPIWFHPFISVSHQ